MEQDINFIIFSINAYADYETRDMAGSMRVKNIFNPLLKKKNITISNLIMLDLFGIEHNDHRESVNPAVDCLSIGYRSIKFPLSVIRFFRKGMGFIKAHHKKGAANIIYNYQYPDIRNFLLLLYAKYKGYKIVFDFVEDKKHDIGKTWNDKIHKKVSLLFLNLTKYYADAIFVISSHLVTEITRITKKRVPVFLLPISVDFDNINRYPSTADDNITRIFYGGSFAKKDGLEYLLEAIEILKERNYSFKMIMSGKAEASDMQKIFPKFKDNDVVTFMGFLSTEAYFRLLNSVDICCMTRNNSAFANAGFPFKLGEFLAAGKLIIASRIGDVDQYLTHKKNAYLVTPESTADIVAGLSYYMDNLQPLAATMGGEARKVAEQHFDAAVSSEVMLAKCISIL